MKEKLTHGKTCVRGDNEHTEDWSGPDSVVIVMFPNRNIRAYGGCLGSNKR